MSNSKLRLTIKQTRAINNAEIQLNGITVIAGVNGCGKSTISKLLYSLIKTSIKLDEIIEENARFEIQQIYKTVDFISRELTYILDKNEYQSSRNTLRKLVKNQELRNPLHESNDIFIAIDFLIDTFTKYNSKKILNSVTAKIHLNRIMGILSDFIGNDDKIFSNDIIYLLVLLKERTLNKLENVLKQKEERPLSILKDELMDAFYDFPIPQNFDLFEYGLSIIDKKQKQLLPLHSIKKIAYIDTPMILGIDNFSERIHWEDLNSFIQQKRYNSSRNGAEKLFMKDILNGEFDFSDESELSADTLIYKRDDGYEFELIECATGLKSFAILQMLLKNGFLNKNTLLIIDEPEVHLHPQWIIEYARLIVLLNKNLGVKFLIASHNPDMISAIKYISEKEEISDCLNFYLAQKIKNQYLYDYKYLGTEIDEIFLSFNIALEKIDLYGKTI